MVLEHGETQHTSAILGQPAGEGHPTGAATNDDIIVGIEYVGVGNEQGQRRNSSVSQSEQT